ncbi:MAG: T9SS type A sorting domain-containing protein [Caldithrix sp.]|nr:T9SS type A sorting domain-containing protein [Caldithrix sp.]
MKRILLCSFVFVFLLAVTGPIMGQEQIGGPYTTDENTMLLMHFDDDLINVSDKSADGQAHGVTYYVPNNISGLGQALRIDNDSQSDSSFVTVADTAYLDLTGNWTIEGWINIFTFGEGGSDWRWVPRLVIKTGDEVFWRPNYWVEMWGSDRFFSMGYHTATQDQWPQVNTPENTMEVGKWYHMAYIRDTSRHVLIGLVHNENRELVNFNVVDYMTFGDENTDHTPITTDQPLHIGYAGGGGDSFLDGFVDEVRISDNVREFPVPPIITNVSEWENQSTDTPEYPVEAKIYSLFNNVTSRTLYYDAGNGWQQVDMTATGEEDMYAATIPQQPVDSKIKYFVKAVDDEGLEFTQPQKAEELENYYEFIVYEVQPNSNTLSLDFESGSGMPVDGGVHSHDITMMGNPQYKSDVVADGSYSMYLEGDSSYMEVESPYLNSEEYTVDFWMNADSAHTYCRIINRPIDPGNWYQNCYQIRFNPDSRLLAGGWNEYDGYVTAVLDDSVHLGKWYHLIYEVQKAPEGDTTNYYGIFQLRDESDNFMSQKYFTFDSAVVQASAPLRIGYAAGRAHYEGYLDNINIYNYPNAALTPKDSTATAIDREKNLAEIPNRYSLAQNYPNPFNPTTEIKFSIGRHEKVSLVVYNILGQEVRTLINDDMVPGEHKIAWNGTDDSGRRVATGVYIYKLKTDNFSKVKKMVFMK